MGAICCREELLDLDGEVDLSHFTLLRSVGKGAFGKVRIVQHKGTKQLYALKYINKTKCIQMKAVENIISERRLLEQINCKLIVNMRYAFQDDENLFMVLDLMLGGDLRFHLDRLGIMPEKYVKFYAAEISLSLNHLHSLNILHRDLKPDNILLDEQGHAHLTDFNIATIISNSKPLTSVAGSFAYIAPEILLKKGYLSSVDWWSLGIVVYELLFGKRPFRGKTNEALQHAILHENLTFPDNHKISPHAIDFIKCLLTRDATNRIGVGQQGFQRLAAHPWFYDIPWEKLETKEASPPFIPDSKRANFDPTHELEEILLEDNPLKVKKRNHKRSGPATSYATSFKSQATGSNVPDQSPERQRMEDKFLTFDFSKPQVNVYHNITAEQNYSRQRPRMTTEEKQNLHSSWQAYGHSGRNTGSNDIDKLAPNISTSSAKNDNLKMEELGRPKDNYSEWMHPSTLKNHNSSPVGSPSIEQDHYYAFKNDRVSSSQSPTIVQNNYNSQECKQASQLINNSSMATENTHHNFNSNDNKPIRHDHHKYSQNNSTQSSSDDSCRLETSSPDNSEYPLMNSVAVLNVEYNSIRTHSAFNNRNPYPASAISTASSHTLNYPSRSFATSNSSTSSFTPSVSRHIPARMSSIPRLHTNPLPPPTGLPPPIPTDLPPLPPLPRNFV
ncbi:MAG: kinase-like domain-containing protein [Benjaminiella poitrasii]|nr:MAG: kinase-like domain-containing protein [Benjaminiella poitrasii]